MLMITMSLMTKMAIVTLMIMMTEWLGDYWHRYYQDQLLGEAHKQKYQEIYNYVLNFP